MKNNKNLKVWGMSALLVGLLLLPSTLLLAQSTSIPAEHPSLYKGVRPLGMGNAFIAMPGSDENAAFYNPAAINDYKRLGMRIVSPTLDFSTSIIGLVNDTLDLSDAIDAATTDGAKIEEFRNFVNQHIGEFQSIALRLPILQLQHKWFVLSTLADSRTTISFRNRTVTNFELSSRSDAGGLIGTAFGFWEDQVQVGLNLKVLYRISVDETITTDDITTAAKFSDVLSLNRAPGVGFDLGLKGKVPSYGQKWLEVIKPTVGFTWQDIGNTRFSGAVPDTTQSIGLGVGIHPTLGQWEFHVENDFRELNQSVAFIRKWNIGAEVVAPKLLILRPSFRLGANQGYIAAGTSFDFRFLKLEFATYAEEAGVFSRQRENRRIALNLSFGF